MSLSPNLPPDKQHEMLRQMLTIRRFEERASDDYRAGKISGVVVDGNDAFAVHQAANVAVARARAGDGPTLIECKTYRWRGHTERPGQTDPRDRTEVEAWQRRDPIALLERQLREQGELDDAGRQAMERDIMSALEAAVAFAEASPFPLPEQATDDVFAA